MRRYLMLLMFIIGVLTSYGSSFNYICLNPYIPEESELTQFQSEALLNKLKMIATVNSLSGEGLDSRFVISGDAQIIEEAITSTFPQKTVIKVLIRLFIGDGLTGILFSSYANDYNGIGIDIDAAVISAIGKINPNDKNIQEFLKNGCKRISEYYEDSADDIFASAKAEMASGNTESAIWLLRTIPMGNANYNEAQTILSEYGRKVIDNNNLALINNAKQVWSTSPDENGANQVDELLSQVSFPSNQAISEINKLTKDITTRIKSLNDKQWQWQVEQEKMNHKKEMTRINNENKVELAKIEKEKQCRVTAIKAAESVLKAKYENQPRRIVYRIHHWW